MRPISQNEIQPLLLSMLKAFDSFATNNKIDYLATGGTLLGTIRHHGFIPWDDDIDLDVTEETAKTIISLVEKSPYIDDEKRYKILLPATFPNVYPIFKLIDTKTVVYEKNISKKYACGLWIDIFILNYWPNSLEESEKLFAKQKRIKKMLQLSIFGNLKETKYRLVAPFAMIAKGLMLATGKNSEYWGKKLYHLGVDYETNYLGNLAWASTMRDRYPAYIFDSSTRSTFEDMIIPIPAKYDEKLTQFYKNYMQLPPEDQRIRHNYEAYYID